MSVSSLNRLAPQTGCAFVLRARETLEVVSPTGAQVADLTAFALDDMRERFSSGRTLDYNERAYLKTDDILYSNRSRALLRIVRDDAGRHDFLLAPCSARMFEVLRGMHGHASCHANLANALRQFGIAADEIDATLNIFMDVRIDHEGKIEIRAPSSKPGGVMALRAETDLVVGLTACSSEYTNDGSCKPIEYAVRHGGTVQA